MDTITFEVDGKRKTVKREDYVKAKTKTLQEYGYPSLTEVELDEQITALQEGKDFGDGLTVIGMFMENEIIT